METCENCGADIEIYKKENAPKSANYIETVYMGYPLWYRIDNKYCHLCGRKLGEDNG